jgi:hypothetical protein
MDPEDRPSDAEVRSALANLRVGLVCVPEENATLAGEVAQAGYGEDFRVRGQVCLARTPRIPAS